MTLAAAVVAMVVGAGMPQKVQGHERPRGCAHHEEFRHLHLFLRPGRFNSWCSGVPHSKANQDHNREINSWLVSVDVSLSLFPCPHPCPCPCLSPSPSPSLSLSLSLSLSSALPLPLLLSQLYLRLCLCICICGSMSIAVRIKTNFEVARSQRHLETDTSGINHAVSATDEEVPGASSSADACNGKDATSQTQGTGIGSRNSVTHFELEEENADDHI